MANMKVNIYVTLACLPEEKHYEAMRSTALDLTDAPASVAITPSEECEKTLVAQFSVPKARQMDVVDKLIQHFEDFIPDSQEFGADFPRSTADDRKAQRASERAKAKRKAAREDKKDPNYACFICGKRTKLTKTSCCDRWICDDEHKYVPFSYARNSCSRNHRRLTLCSYHYTENHKGDWKTCKKCREGFETEIYVWYGTNEYNWEKLPNPPSYAPTLCYKCSKKISLSLDAYASSADGYLCEACYLQAMQ